MKKFLNVVLCGVLAAVMVVPSSGGGSACEAARKAYNAEIAKAPLFQKFVTSRGKVVFYVNYKAKFAYALVRLYCGVR